MFFLIPDFILHIICQAKPSAAGQAHTQAQQNGVAAQKKAPTASGDDTAKENGTVGTDESKPIAAKGKDGCYGIAV